MSRKNSAIRIDKVRNRRRLFFGAKTLIQLALLAIVITATFVIASNIMDDIAATEAELAAVQAQIEAAEARGREIEDSAAYVQSIQFIESIARERLGLVRRDEIIFIITQD